MKTCVVSIRGKGLLLVIALWLSLVLRAFSVDLLVYNNNDSGPGSLRQAIMDNNVSAGGNSIVFSNIVTGTIILTSGELLVTRSGTIVGPGANVLAVSGNHASRVFHVTSNALTVEISGLTITNGAASGSFPGDSGGGIWNDHSTLNLHNCVVSGNYGSLGGGIFNDGSTPSRRANLQITDCTISNNSCSGGGGGIYNYGSDGIADLAVSGSTICGNTASNSGGVGGAIWNNGNFSGIVIASVTRSTISGNTAGYRAGGIYHSGAASGSASLTVAASTISSNSSPGAAGGIFVEGFGGTAFLQVVNTILKAGASGANLGNNGGIISSTFGYNLSSDGGGGYLTNATDQINTDPLLGPLADNGGPTFTHALLAGSPAIDKGKSYGDTTDQRGKPRPFDFGSIPNASGGDGSDIGAVEAPTPRTLVVSNINNSGAGSLRQAMLDANSGLDDKITFATNVTGTITLTGELTANAPMSIRGPGSNVLSVSGNQISRVFTILAGPTEISGLTIRDGRVVGADGGQGNHGSEAFAGGIYSQASLTLSNCVVRSNTVVGGLGGVRHNGSVGNGGRGIGGGLYNAGGNFTLINSSFIGNRAVGGQGGSAQNSQAGGGGNGLGAAIGTSGGTNQIIACDFVDSTAQGGAGGISGGGEHGFGGQGYGAGLYSESDVNILKSTFRSGTALGGASGGGNGSGYGGGIYNGYNLALRSCTITSNNASGSSIDRGGGVYNSGAVAGLTNCTIARNQADSGGGWYGNATVANSIFAGNSAGSGADFSGTMNSSDYNLIQNSAGLNLIGATANVLIGVDPMLGPLRDNGGPTPTHALLSNSPAIDKGRSFGVTTDQRGAPRPFDFASLTNAPGGDGSDIGAFELGCPILNLQRLGGDAVLSWPSYYGDFNLQSSTNAASPISWITASGTAAVVGNDYRQTNGPISTNRFFRLRGN